MIFKLGLNRASPWQPRTSGSLSGLTSLFFFFFFFFLVCVLAGLAVPKIDAIYDSFRPF